MHRSWSVLWCNGWHGQALLRWVEERTIGFINSVAHKTAIREPVLLTQFQRSGCAAQQCSKRILSFAIELGSLVDDGLDRLLRHDIAYVGKANALKV